MVQQFPGRGFRNYPIQGSTAVDTGARKLGRVQLPEDRPLPPVPAPAARPALAPFVVLGLAVVAFLGILIIFGSVRLYETTLQAAELQQQLTRLQMEEEQLQRRYETEVDLLAVREQAEAMGMHVPAEDQIVYLRLGAVDHAVITPAGPSLPAFLNLLADFFRG